jgi:uncharacterized protein YcbX
MTATVTDLFRYPVKSMGGHSLTAANVGAQGIAGDRCWTLRDDERGGIKGGKRFAAIMGMSATLDTEPTVETPSPAATITLADGTSTHTEDPEVNAILTAAIGHPVSIWPLFPADQLEHYLRQPQAPDTDPETALREVFARTPQEPLPDLSAFPPELFTYESPPGTYFDAFDLLVMSSSSLAAVAASRTNSNFDVRRFRPNIVVDTPSAGFVEESWAGQSGRLGGAVLKFEMACPRCIMTTHGFADLPADTDIMRGLVEANNGNLGIYARVLEPGLIRAGDTLTLDA